MIMEDRRFLWQLRALHCRIRSAEELKEQELNKENQLMANWLISGHCYSWWALDPSSKVFQQIFWKWQQIQNTLKFLQYLFRLIFCTTFVHKLQSGYETTENCLLAFQPFNKGGRQESKEKVFLVISQLKKILRISEEKNDFMTFMLVFCCGFLSHLWF